MSLYLTPEELAETTDYKHRAKQKIALAKMGIPFRVSPLDNIKVLRSDLTMVKNRGKAANDEEPNLDVL